MDIDLNPYIVDPGSPSGGGSPLIQQMPEGRARVNPIVIPALTVILLTYLMRYESVLKQAVGGRSSQERARIRGEKIYARHALAVVEDICTTLLGTLPLDVITRLGEAYVAGADRLAGEAGPTGLQQPGCDDTSEGV